MLTKDWRVIESRISLTKQELECTYDTKKMCEQFHVGLMRVLDAYAVIAGTYAYYRNITSEDYGVLLGPNRVKFFASPGQYIYLIKSIAQQRLYESWWMPAHGRLRDIYPSDELTPKFNNRMNYMWQDIFCPRVGSFIHEHVLTNPIYELRTSQEVTRYFRTNSP